MPRIILILDGALADTARFLRMFGVSSFLFSGSGDSLLKEAEGLGAVPVTRDPGLSERAKTMGNRPVLLASDNPEDQLVQLAEELGLPYSFPGNARCPECNGSLELRRRWELGNQLHNIPPDALSLHDEFRFCGGCGKIYWQDATWVRALSMLEKVQERVRTRVRSP
ncbi:MAG: Mut7-C RNAse domain-containing protein [Candidatus Bilamarchaeaceae archaeon]